MRKLKLFMVACALMGAGLIQQVRAAAVDYLDGWEEVTSLPTSNDDLDDYYYVFVSTDAELMMAQEYGLSKLGDTQEGQLTMVYRTPANPLSHKTMVWTLEYSETYLYGIRNLNNSTYLMQSREGEPWRVQFAWEADQSKWTRWNFAYSDGWTIENNACMNKSENTYYSGYYIGPWNSKAFADNNVVAANKQNDEVGKFKIYRMLRTIYDAKNVTSTYLTNPSFEVTPVVTEDGFDARKNSVSGWTFTKVNDQSRFAIGTQTADDGHMGYVGSSVKPTDGNYYLSLRGRWHDKSSNEGGTVSQTISSLPKGKYTLTADYQLFINASGKGSATFTLETNGGSYLNTQNGIVGITASASTSNWNTHKPQTVSFDFDYMTGNTTFKLAFASTANAQVLLDNVNLIYNANYTDALQSAIARATAMNNRKNTVALTSAIETAQGVLDGRTNLITYQSTIDEAVTSLNSVIATTWSSLKTELASGEDITFLVENSGFEYSTPVQSGVVTTIKDAKTNNTPYGMMQNVSGWEMAVINGDNHSSGVFKYGETPWLGGTDYSAPETAPEGSSENNALGIVAVWTATTQYKQNVTLPSGRYEITIPIYNKVGGTTSFSKNLFGFVEDGGTEHLATAKTYAVNVWTTETISFDLNDVTSGYLSLGYTSVNNGSGNMPHLFIDGIKITFTDAENAYNATKSAAQEIYDAAAYASIKGTESSTERSDLKALLDADASSYTVAQYFEAIDNINNAVATFTAAKTSYDEYAEANAIATTISADAVTAPTTAAEAVTRAHELNVNIDAKVNATYRYDVTYAYAGSWTGSIGTTSSQHWSDNSSTTYLDNNGSGTISNTQVLSLPAGDYIFKMAGRGSSNATAVTMTANGQTVHFACKGDTGLGIDKTGAANFTEADETYCNSNNGRGWEWRFIPISLDEATDVTVILTIERASSTWASFSDFTILLNGPSAEEANYTALSEAVTAAESRTLGFDVDEYAPYTNIDILRKLSVAKAINPAEDHSQILINDLTATLNSDANWNANDSEVNTVSGELFSGVEYGTAGWTRSVGWNNIGDDGSYSIPAGTMTYGTVAYHEMPLKAETIYTLSFGHRKWDNNNSDNGGTVSVLNENSQGLGVTSYSGTSEQTLQTETIDFRTGAAGNYTFTISAESGRLTFGNVMIKKAVAKSITISEDATTAPVLWVANATLTRTLSASYWNTFSVPFDMEIPAGWTVKEFDSAVDNVINFKDATTIKAGKPYLVKPADDVVNPTFNGVIVENTEGETVGEGDYKFAAQIYNKALATNGTIAYLSTDGKVKKLTSGSLKGLRAYFIIPASGAPARIAFLDDDDQTTGISEMKSQPVDNGNIYDLNGRRVQTMKKGIYVVNGKKIVK